MLLNCFLTAVICSLLSGIAVYWITVFNTQAGSDANLARALARVLVPVAGALVGVGLGVLGSNVLPRPVYLKLLGIGAAFTAVAGIGSIAVVWKTADREPTIGGKLLDVEFELKTPPGFPLPDAFTGRPEFDLLGGGVHVGDFALDLTHVTGGDGGWIIHDFCPLKTRRAERSLNIFLEGKRLSFDISGETSESRFQWSPWIAEKEAGRFQLRYRLRRRTQVVKTEPDKNVLQAQAIAALSPDAPIEAWIQHLRYDLPEEPRNQIAAILERRQAELLSMIHSGDAAGREQAMTAVRYLNASSPELDQAVLGEGRAIADAIERLHGISAEDAQFDALATEVSSRFDVWRSAWWAIHSRKANFDATPLRDIHQRSERYATTRRMREVWGDSRLMLERSGTAPRP